MRKKTILIYALSRTPWIGGVYYKKNIAHMMSINPNITKKYDIVVLTNKKYSELFLTVNNIKIETCWDKTGIVGAVISSIYCCFKYNIRYLFPIMPYSFFKAFHITPISWIADFQHNHYPEFFTDDEVKKRNKNFKFIANSNNPLVLSSNDALNDFRHYYSNDRNNVHVVHFTSYIDDEIKKLKEVSHAEILTKYDLLNSKYCIVCNQFWKHKNHIVVFEAIKELKILNELNDMIFVFTGEPSDRRNPEYYNELMSFIKDKSLKDNIKILGFIGRIDQLCLMEHAALLIQPSIFEGWGTVVEDGKVLQKKILLSDIPVHREQQNENCILFNPYNPSELATLIKINTTDKINVKIIKDRSYEYSKNLEKIFV